MSWPPSPPARESLPPDELDAYDRVLAQQTSYGYSEFVRSFLHDDVLRSFPGSTIQPYFAAMLNSPLVAAGMSDLGTVYRTRDGHPDGLARADREWADMVVCDEVGNNWVLYVHAPDAIAVGVRPEGILALIDGRYDDLTAEEREKERFIRAIVRGDMTAEQYGSVERMLGVRATVELTCFTGHLIKTTAIMRAFGIPDITSVQLREWIQALVDDRVELPDRDARIPAAPSD